MNRPKAASKITHREIVDRFEAHARESAEAYQAECQRVRKEAESLRELCGGLGHFFKIDNSSFMGGRRTCVYCGAAECTPADKVSKMAGVA